MTLYSKYKQIEKIGTEVKTPHHVGRCFGGPTTAHTLSIMGPDICLSDNGDYVSFKEAREALQWYVEQLGGSIKWKKD